MRRARGAYGLGATVYTRDLRTVVRCLHEIKAGTLCSTIR
ncbi:MAG: aldehyde dehydrogenase family protein [Actinomycetota bacterium]|nr:aldehyde dehydrogenase family protein [Actinomycetota bacterium]